MLLLYPGELYRLLGASSFLPYLCLHTVGLVRMEVVWVCFDVLFFISEFHFLFLLIFILFWLACIYFVLLVFSFRCLFQCLFVCLFISFVFPFCIYLLFMLCDYFIIFFFESISCSKTRLSYSVCLLIDCIRCILENFS